MNLGMVSLNAAVRSKRLGHVYSLSPERKDGDNCKPQAARPRHGSPIIQQPPQNINADQFEVHVANGSKRGPGSNRRGPDKSRSRILKVKPVPEKRGVGRCRDCRKLGKRTKASRQESTFPKSIDEGGRCEGGRREPSRALMEGTRRSRFRRLLQVNECRKLSRPTSSTGEIPIGTETLEEGRNKTDEDVWQ